MGGFTRMDLSGKRFGRLTALGYSHTNASRKAVWNCRCDCGSTVQVIAAKLRGGYTRSCGCLKQESLKTNLAKRLIHGGVGTPAYKSWSAAKERCFNPNNDHWEAYGGAGITMCERWRNSFSAFLADMGSRPSGTTLDRYPDQRGNYEPGNCHWATPLEQAHNRKWPRKRKVVA